MEPEQFRRWESTGSDKIAMEGKRQLESSGVCACGRGGRREVQVRVEGEDEGKSRCVWKGRTKGSLGACGRGGRREVQVRVIRVRQNFGGNASRFHSLDWAFLKHSRSSRKQRQRSRLGGQLTKYRSGRLRSRKVEYRNSFRDFSSIDVRCA